MDIAPYLPGILTTLGTALLAGVGYILRTLSGQNKAMGSQSQALAVLITRVDPAIDNVQRTQSLSESVIGLDARLKAVETEQTYIRGALQGSTVTLTAN